jgi:glutamate-ammonia-ligase adenylyltransferase
MPAMSPLSGWIDTPLLSIPTESQEEHVRYCSYFASDMLDHHPEWMVDLDQHLPPDSQSLQAEIMRSGLDAGLRRYRNRQMLRIIWRDLCGLATLAETFSDLTMLAEICLQAAVDGHSRHLQEKYGKPRSEDGSEQQLIVIGMGKLGGEELNLSSDIDVMFCYPQSGECDGRRNLANDQFFTRLVRAVISSLSDITGDGFPLTSSLAAMEQYYQREGRDWERYALIKARPVAGDLESGAQLLKNLQPFVYRRYIDFGSVEALQEMHANVHEDARRKDRLDDIKRGPGGIREIEFLSQCFQILRGGRESSLQTPSLDRALEQIETLELMSREVVEQIRRDYVYLRRLENRIQALRDQQTHQLPQGEDLGRIAQGMGEESPEALTSRLASIRQQVSDRFEGIFPSQPAPSEDSPWSEKWRELKARQRRVEMPNIESDTIPIANFLRRLERFVLSRRASRRLDHFMPVLLEHIDRKSLDHETLNRIFDLVLAICRRSAYLVLLVQNVPALDRMLELFARSEWVAARVIRFPALLDELIDPSLGQQIPTTERLTRSVARLLDTAQDTESVLEGLNYLRLATSLRIAVAQLEDTSSGEQARRALSGLAGAILKGVLEIASREIESRHGCIAAVDPGSMGLDQSQGDMAIIAYGTLGAFELGYDSDLDIVFLFEASPEMSDGKRPLPAERYYARLAQRVLSFLTMMTPSGRLYEVDTRLRPNGRAGSLVSTVSAFREYQLNEAWTWEMQALTRARYITGSDSLRARFERIRQEVLCRSRNADELRAELLDMRQRMNREHEANARLDTTTSPKHCPGGLIDIEFIAQLGILVSAQTYPRVLQSTGTLDQIVQLKSIGWLTTDEASVLEDAVRNLSLRRMRASLAHGETLQPCDTRKAARIFASKLGFSERLA